MATLINSVKRLVRAILNTNYHISRRNDYLQGQCWWSRMGVMDHYWSVVSQETASSSAEPL